MDLLKTVTLNSQFTAWWKHGLDYPFMCGCLTASGVSVVLLVSGSGPDDTQGLDEILRTDLPDAHRDGFGSAAEDDLLPRTRQGVMLR